MPKVGKRKYPYTKKGKAAARTARAKAMMKRMTPYGGSRKK